MIAMRDTSNAGGTRNLVWKKNWLGYWTFKDSYGKARKKKTLEDMIDAIAVKQNFWCTTHNVAMLRSPLEQMPICRGCIVLLVRAHTHMKDKTTQHKTHLQQRTSHILEVASCHLLNSILIWQKIAHFQHKSVNSHSRAGINGTKIRAPSTRVQRS